MNYKSRNQTRNFSNLPLGTKIRIDGKYLPGRQISCVETIIVGICNTDTDSYYVRARDGWAMSPEHLDGWKVLSEVKLGDLGFWYIDVNFINSIIG